MSTGGKTMIFDDFKNIFSPKQLSTLASIVQVGDATYRELMEIQQPMFGHRYFNDTRGRLRTKLVQIQCEIESKDPEFPFEFYQREFRYKQCIPELQTKKAIIHIARNDNPFTLPYKSKYKTDLSYRNDAIRRQIIFNANNTPPYSNEPFYGMLVFGGRQQTFSNILFPEPGYKGIAETIAVPQINLINDGKQNETFERKKAVLKEEFLAYKEQEVIS